MKFITAVMLVKAGACHDKVALFRRTFGSRAALTAENLDKAQAAGLDIWWLERLLSPERRDALEAACKPHLDTLEAACKPYLDTYLAARKPYWDTYLAASKPYWDAYWAACQPHLLAALLEE